MNKMGHSRFLGLCLVVALALMVVAAGSSASAAEMGLCVSFKKGKYADPNCTVEALNEGKPKGKFEFEAVGACYATKKGHFSDPGCKNLKTASFETVPPSAVVFTYVGASGLVELVTPGLGKVECASSSTVGKITTSTKGEALTTFAGCQSNGAPCESNPVGTAGEVVTNELEMTLIEPVTGVAEVVFSNTVFAGNPYSSEFFCNAIGAFQRVSGFNGGRVIPVDVVVSNLAFFSGGEFGGTVKQDLITEFECAPGEWTGEVSSAVACAGVGLPAGLGPPPAGGQFHTEVFEETDQEFLPALEVKVN